MRRPTATVAGSPYPITPSAAVGTGLANYTDHLRRRRAYGERRPPLTITADDRTKIYGQTVIFAGTEFSASGLLNADSRDQRHADERGCRPTATVAGSPYPITPRAAVGTGLGNYAITYVDGALDRDAGAADDHGRRSRSKMYGQTVVFAGTEFIDQRPAQRDVVGSVTLTAPEPRPPRRSPAARTPITPSAAVGTGLGNYTITYVDGALTVTPAPLTITADDRDEGLRPDGRRSPVPNSARAGLLNADDVDQRHARRARVPRPPRPSPAARTRSRPAPRSAPASAITRSPMSTESSP